MTTLVTRSAWKESLLRLLNNNVPLTEAANRCRVGKAMIHQEMRRDEDFNSRLMEATNGRGVT